MAETSTANPEKKTKKKPSAGGAAARGVQTRGGQACMLQLHQLFHEQWNDPNPNRRFLSLNQLGKRIERARATVFRLIEAMRDDYGLPVEFIAERRGYGYTQEVANYPGMQFNQGEIIALFAALNVLKSVRGNPFNDAARSAFDKLALALDGQLSVDLDALESVVCFRSGGFPAKADAAFIDTATQAALAREELTIDYRKLPPKGERPKTKTHRVQPYFLLCACEVWYLFAYDLEAKAIRRFALARVRRMERTGKMFKLPPGYDREKIIGAGFGPGIFGDENPVDVRIRFTGRVVQVIRERNWHPTQVMKSLARNGSDAETADLELTMRVSLNLELENWILSWGNSATVLEPAALIGRLRERIAGLG